MRAIGRGGRPRPKGRPRPAARRKAGSRPGARRTSRGSGQTAARSGLRWIPLPLAILAATLGWLLFGTLLGQSQASVASQPGWVNGGEELSVQQMVWMSNDMTGQGPLKVPQGFPMDPGMMPGMQSTIDNRLRVEVNLQNITKHAQTYAKSDFRVTGPGGHSWPYVDIEGNGPVNATVLQPGYVVTLDLYFDIPIAQSKDLSITWTRGGATVDFPVTTNGVPTPHHH